MITAGHSRQEMEEKSGFSAFIFFLLFFFFSSSCISLLLGLQQGFPCSRAPATESHWALSSCCFSCVSSWPGTRGRFCFGMFWWTEQCKPLRPSWRPHKIEGGKRGWDPGRSLQGHPWSDGKEKEQVIINSDRNGCKLTLCRLHLSIINDTTVDVSVSPISRWHPLNLLLLHPSSPNSNAYFSLSLHNKGINDQNIHL